MTYFDLFLMVAWMSVTVWFSLAIYRQNRDEKRKTLCSGEGLQVSRTVQSHKRLQPINAKS